MQAVGHSGYALQHAAPSLQADEAVVLKAVSSNQDALQYASEGLRRSKDFVLPVIAQHGYSLRLLDWDLRADPDVVLAAVTDKGRSFQYADDTLKRDKAFVLQVVAVDGRALEYASSELRGDAEVAEVAVAQNPKAARFLHTHVHGEVVAAAPKQPAWAAEPEPEGPDPGELTFADGAFTFLDEVVVPTGDVDDADIPADFAFAPERASSAQAQPASAVDHEAVEELVSWGLDRAAVVVALEATGGDRELAANMLLG